MRFVLGDDLLALVPETSAALVVAEGVDPTRSAAAIARLLDDAAAAVATPREEDAAAVAVWHTAFAAVGIDPAEHPPSIENLLTRAHAEDVPRVGPVVDLANAISLKHRVPVGAHDLDKLRGDMQVRLARGDEFFTGLGETHVTLVPNGEPVYADDREVRTRWWVGRQGDRGKVTPATRNVLFPIDGFAGSTAEAARAAAEELAGLASELLGATTRVLWVDRAAPAVDLGREPRELDAIDRLLAKGFVELYPSRGEVERRLRSGEKLRVYIGVDPTSPVIHIGHAVAIRKLGEMQRLGHKIILLIGDFTGRIGDPTGKDASRVPLTKEQVLENAQTYKAQVAKILRFDGDNPAELRFNGDWWDPMTAREMIQLAAQFTVQQMIQRDMFQRRLAENKPIGLHEFTYPLLQGYDSVAMEVDGEVGGTDQTFNMLAGRTLMQALQGREKVVFVTGLLPGTDGRKMSKSFGNVIGVSDPPYDVYARVMSLSDDLLLTYYEMCTDLDEDALDEVRHAFANGVNPMALKKRLARYITAAYHDEAAALAAEERFEREVQRHELPTDMPTVTLSAGAWPIADLLVAAGLTASKGEARRLVDGGAVRLDDAAIRERGHVVQLAAGQSPVLRAGKRSFARLAVGAGAPAPTGG
jgi:tyrosyl-tRNA synthetase